VFARGLPVQPGAQKLLEAVTAAGVPTALVTSTRRALVEIALRSFGGQSFDAMVTGDDVKRAKPDPEPYLLAARRLGVDRSGCVVLEDSPAGVASGVAAGCHVVAVPNAVSIAPRPGVTIVASLADVDLARLEDVFSSADRGRPIPVRAAE
jgi:HAD superfamily hydrolase (TIGR01509 family)